MVASVHHPSSVFEEHLTGRILGRLCEAAKLVSADLSGNRFRLRELLDDLTFELDAGDLAMHTFKREGAHRKSTVTGIRLAGASVQSNS